MMKYQPVSDRIFPGEDRFSTVWWVTIFFVLSLFVTQTPANVSYSLPAAATSAPFNCSGSAPSFTCSGSIDLAKDTTITLTGNLTLNITGDFKSGENLRIISNGYNLNLQVNGSVEFNDGTNFTGNIAAGGDVQIAENSSFTGNITAGGKLEIDKNSTVLGSCTPANSQCSGSLNTCGVINIAQAGFGGSKIKIEGSPTNNGKQLNAGSYTGNAAIAVGAVTATTGNNISLPGIDPATLPQNTSNTIYTIPDKAVINAQTDVYYQELTINGSNSASLQGGGPFHIGRLLIDGSATLNVAAGTYYIDEFEIRNNGILNITSQPVKFYIGKKFTIKDSGKVTGTSVSGFRVFMLNGSQEVKFENNASFTGMVYAPYGTKIEAGDNAIIHASLITSGSLELKNNVAWTLAPSETATNISTCQLVKPVVDHFNISVGAGAASTCTPFSFSITAEDSSNNPVTDYTGSVAISTSTSHGNFAVASATNAISPNPDNDDNGAASYTFASADHGQISLTLDNQHAETLSIRVSDSALSISSASSNVTFSENAFVIVDNDSLVAGNNVPVAGRNHAYQISMVKRDSSGVCAVATNYSGAKNLKLWRSKNAADPSSVAPSLDGDSLPAAMPAANNGAITFSAGVANVLLSTGDIGKYTLEIADVSNTFSDTTIAGTSAQQIVRPFGIGIDFNNLRDADYADNNAIDDSNGVDISYAAGSAGSVFTQAGEGFSATLQGVLWQSADDSNNDGVPDANAYLGDNAVAPSFGAEGESVTLSASVAQPAAASLGSLTVNGSAGGLFNHFSAGSQTATLTYSNVGIINLAAALTDGDYFGSGVNLGGSAPKVGRFNPYQYAVTSSLVKDACSAGAFSYARQPFSASVTIEAQNKAGVRTDGYQAGFDTLDIATELIVHNSETAAAFDLQTFALQQGFSAGTPGSAQFDLALRWDMGLQGKTIALVQLTATSDEVTRIAAAPVTLGSTEVRLGRLRLDNTYGSELIDLTMPMHTEYFDGTNFVLNTADSCSTMSSANLVVSSALSGGSSSVTVVTSPASGGILNIGLTAPGAGNHGDITITANLTAAAQKWLQFDWNGDGHYDNDPSAKATFGIYSGDSKQIYIRQIFQ